MLLVRASHRGRGVATAMLAHLLGNGWTGRLVTPAGPELAAWLTRRAFTQSPDAVLLERLLRKVVAPAPGVPDEYVGCYVADAMPDAPIVIERDADTLISKARVVLGTDTCASERFLSTPDAPSEQPVGSLRA